MSPGFRRWLPLILILPVTVFAIILGADWSVRDALLHRKEKVLYPDGSDRIVYRQNRWFGVPVIVLLDGGAQFTGSNEIPEYVVVSWHPESELAQVYLFPDCEGAPAAEVKVIIPETRSTADPLDGIDLTPILAERGWRLAEVNVFHHVARSPTLDGAAPGG